MITIAELKVSHQNRQNATYEQDVSKRGFSTGSLGANKDSMVTAYLDTCVVSGLAKGDLSELDAMVLVQILRAHKQRRLSLVTSEVTKTEILAVPPQYRAKHEIVYNLLADVPMAATHRTDSGLTLLGVGGGRREDSLFTSLKSVLPDVTDAEHVFQAAKNSVEYLITTDHRTLIRHEADILKLSGVKVVSPETFGKLLAGPNNA